MGAQAAKSTFVATDCTNRAAKVSFTINGQTFDRIRCGFAFPFGPDGRTLPFPLGTRVTVTLAVDSDGGLAQLAVYRGVPLDEDVFPPRPAKLAAPPTNVLGPSQVVADSTKLGATATANANANANANAKRTLGYGTPLPLGTSAPGQLEVFVDGTQISTFQSWDWKQHAFPVFLTPDDLARYGIKSKAGQTVRITMRASRFAVPGRVVSALP